MTFLTYEELPRPSGEKLPLAWGIWGPEEQIGTWNNVTPDAVVKAANLIKTGKRFNLNLPLHIPLGMVDDGAHPVRRAPVQTLYNVGTGYIIGRDDKIELYPQASTQWDGLTHIGDAKHGFYNGVQAEQVTQKEGTKNGIEHVAAFGVATRAVLVDLPTHFAAVEKHWSPMGSLTASAEDIDDCLRRTGTSLRRGDVLLVRTGWLKMFLEASPTARNSIFRERTYSGLSGQEDMWEYLWNNRVAAVASDTVGVEVFPITGQEVSLHRAIARLGLTLGEMFDLEALSEHCLKTGSYECFFTSMPLNIRGGVGSPPNAMAIV